MYGRVVGGWDLIGLLASRDKDGRPILVISLLFSVGDPTTVVFNGRRCCGLSSGHSRTSLGTRRGSVSK